MAVVPKYYTKQNVLKEKCIDYIAIVKKYIFLPFLLSPIFKSIRLD